MRILLGVVLVSALAVTSLAEGPAAQSQAAGPAIDSAKIDKYMQERIEADKYPSLSIAVVYDQKMVYAKAYGVADRKTGRSATTETLYRIGSVTKVFTTTLMCILRDRGVVRLDDPVSKYLPRDVPLPSDPRGAPVITLRDLATHTSGLPKLPPNVTPKGEDPYGGYTVQQLYAGLAQTSLICPTGARPVYSNMGVALLGHVLELAAGQPYEAMLKKYLLDPLGMKNTTVALSAQQRERFSLPYNGEGSEHETADWDLGCLVPAGGLASTPTDLAKFVSLQFRAGQADVTPVRGGTLTELQTPQRLTDGWKGAIGLGWPITPMEGLGDMVWHNGGTGGHHSFVGFVPGKKVGVIVLTNASKPVDDLGVWLLGIALEGRLREGPSTQPLPTAAEVLDRFIEVTGGAKVYAGIHTMVVRSKGSLIGIPVRQEAYQTDAGRFFSNMNKGLLGSSQIGSDGRTVWDMDGGTARVLTGQQRGASLRDANPARDLRWRDLYKHAECKGIVEFEGQSCYNVLLISSDDLVEDRYYDVRTGLLVGRRMTIPDNSSGDIQIEEVYADYGKYGEILYPATQTSRAAGCELVLKVEGVEINAEIPDSKFELPAAVKALLEKGAASQEELSQLYKVPTTAPASQPGPRSSQFIVPPSQAGRLVR